MIKIFEISRGGICVLFFVLYVYYLSLFKLSDYYNMTYIERSYKAIVVLYENHDRLHCFPARSYLTSYWPFHWAKDPLDSD